MEKRRMYLEDRKHELGKNRTDMMDMLQGF